jgi:glycerophosphoryl diester phosphodiesterase
MLCKRITILVLLLCPLLALAQESTAIEPGSTPFLIVKDIVIKGNKKTKPYVIGREIQFVTGDSLPAAALADELEKARQQIYNTTLFTEVKVTASMLSAQDIVVNVDVKERWYIFPVPQFKPADRNLNEWLKTYKGDLDRVNYGIKFVHYNLSGRRDQLRIFFNQWLYPQYFIFLYIARQQPQPYRGLYHWRRLFAKQAASLYHFV